MEDEYGDMSNDGQTHVFRSHTLESGRVLRQVPVNFKTWGSLNRDRTNALVVVTHSPVTQAWTSGGEAL